MGTGTLGSQTYYIYYKRVDNGFVLEIIPTDGVVIIEDSKQSPAIVKIKRISVGELSSGVVSEKTQIIVPEHTIIQEFKL